MAQKAPINPTTERMVDVVDTMTDLIQDATTMAEQSDDSQVSLFDHDPIYQATTVDDRTTVDYSQPPPTRVRI